MIDVIEYDDGLPVSIIVPLSEKRKKFFNEYVFPLLEANRVKEIIINNNFGSAPKKRNEGFKKATQEYVMFCDDDILLPSDYIEKLYDYLINARKENSNVGYCYTGYKGIVLNPETHPIKNNFDIPSIKFDADSLKRGNYISTMSLVCKECLPEIPFDESLKRLQDWNLWLTMLDMGCVGVLYPYDSKFMAFYLDEGITSNSNNETDAILTVLRKHKLM